MGREGIKFIFLFIIFQRGRESKREGMGRREEEREEGKLMSLATSVIDPAKCRCKAQWEMYSLSLLQQLP